MHVSRETFANRGNVDKLVYRHFRGAASCDCFLIALLSGTIANTHRASAVKIHLCIFIAEPQDVAIASLLPCFLVQSPTRSNISELPDVIPADAGIARGGKKLTPTKSGMTTFKTRNSQPTTHNSQLITHNSPLTTQNFYIFSSRGPT